MLKKSFSIILGVAFAGFHTCAISQEAASIQWKAFNLTPILTTDFGFSDNVTYASESDEKIESWFYKINPRLNLSTEIGSNRINFDYEVSKSQYLSSSTDNYVDQLLNLRSVYDANSQHKLSGNIYYEIGHDERGRNFSNGNGNSLTSLDTWKETGGRATYSYGTPSATGHLDFNLDYKELNYDIKQDNYIFRDRSHAEISGQFYYRLGALTNLILDVGQTYINYKRDFSPSNSLDSVKTRVLGGIDWKSTSTTIGYLKVGYEQREFDSDTRQDFSGLDWEVGVTWKPLIYSTFELSSFFDTRETNTNADYISQEKHAFSWVHEWPRTIETTIETSFTKNDFKGFEGGRVDKIYNVKAAVDYLFRRWLQVGIFYEFKKRDSDREVVLFDQNVVGISARITL